MESGKPINVVAPSRLESHVATLGAAATAEPCAGAVAESDVAGRPGRCPKWGVEPR